MAKASVKPFRNELWNACQLPQKVTNRNLRIWRLGEITVKFTIFSFELRWLTLLAEYTDWKQEVKKFLEVGL